MPLQRCRRGESCRPAEDPAACAWIRRKVEARGEKKIASLIRHLGYSTESKKYPLATHPRLQSQGHGEEGIWRLLWGGQGERLIAQGNGST